MHICFVCREYPLSLRGGGIASYVRDIAHGLHDAGNQVTVVAASDDTRFSSEEDDGGVRVIRLSGGDFYIPQKEKGVKLKKLRVITRFFSYRKKIKNTILSLQHVDIIEVAEFGAESYYLNTINIPVVIRLHCPSLLDLNNQTVRKLSIHNILYYWQGLQEIKLIKNAKYITSCSKHLKKWVENNFSLSEDKIKVIYNAIQIDKWAQNSGNIFKSKKTAILSVGTICETKGSEDLVKACELLEKTDKNINFELSFVGKTGTFTSYLIKKYGHHSWLNIVGILPREKVMELYKGADIICLPSWWENMPMVCIEAMSQGAIVLGSTSGGMAEIIEDGKNGFLVEPKNPEKLSECLRKIIDMKEGRKVISQNAQKRIRESFCMDVIVQQMIDYYNYVISDFKKKSR